MTGKLKDQVALVTGSSRGLGRAMAVELARQGARVIINYRRRQTEAEVTLAQVREAGSDGMLYQADITDHTQVQRMFQELFKRFRRLDVLVNNAGITRDAYFLMMSDEGWQDVLKVHLNGVFYCAKAAARLMVRQRSGVIVNIGSGAGLVAMPGQINYSAAKAGLLGFNRSLASEVSPKGVRVVLVAPGFIKTDMAEGLPKAFIEETLRVTPLGRWGTPQEVATLVGFLASAEGAGLNGQTIVIDGGRGAVESEFGFFLGVGHL
jgi:3-oxoacyl-[acyl-carrier protein] reductase